MRRIVCAAIALLLCAGIAMAGQVNQETPNSKLFDVNAARTIARFGVITDLHHTNKADSKSRKYSAALVKAKYFADTMNREKVDFVVELGDLVDMLAAGKDPMQNLREIEDVYTSFNGPHYHVLGNHEFDNVEREVLINYLKNTGIPAGQTYYSFDQNGIHCVVLDADYTNEEPHRPFDMIKEGEKPWWTWKDAWVPQEQLDWLAADLAASDKPTVVFTHQVMSRDKLEGVTENHTIKNADAVRKILEKDGQVLAVFSGHDHRGEVAVRNGIHYYVLEGNVGISRDWPEVSPTGGMDPKADCPFALVEIKEDDKGTLKIYQINIKGNAQQYSYVDQVEKVVK